MATMTQTERDFSVSLGATDGRVRITRTNTGRVALSLSIDEAAQIKAGLKGALQPNKKKPKKHAKRKRA